MQGTAGQAYNQAVAVGTGTTPYQALYISNVQGGVQGISIIPSLAGDNVTVRGTPTSIGANVVGTGYESFTVNLTDATGTTFTTNYTISFVAGNLYKLVTGLGAVTNNGTNANGSTIYSTGGAINSVTTAMLCRFTSWPRTSTATWSAISTACPSIPAAPIRWRRSIRLPRGALPVCRERDRRRLSSRGPTATPTAT